MSAGATSIAVTVPAYQAAPSVGEVVRRCRLVSDQVLVVDDGSTDGTAAVSAAAGARVVRHPRNLGKGRALRTAFDDLFARGFDRVVTLDADGQHLPEEVPKLLGIAAGADLVIGSRDHLFGEMHPVRRMSNRCSSYLVSAVAGRPSPDVQSGFRLYSRRLIDAVGFPEPRFEAESAIVVRAVRGGFRVRSVPIALGFADGRVTSHYRPLIDSLRIAIAVARARMESAGCLATRSS
ncbi:MAG TPA: glycosyltransferase family 2 protein [Candidatus Polarisedimenticolaceae bacterium]|nr:glycosyltransferase family 2 protein [Candidatus Polarisedimenticolaceae bacterium]